MKYLLISAFFIVAVAANDSQWKNFKTSYGKNYRNSIEEVIRYQTFAENLKKIAEHNEKYDQGLTTFKKGINQFADLTKEEFLEFVGKAFTQSKSKVPPVLKKENLPSEIDWRKEGAVTVVTNAGQCSSWANGAIGSIEGLNKIVNGTLIPLSYQNIYDCTDSQGCGGGFVTTAFEYVRDFGINSAEDYQPDPSGKCNFNKDKIVIKIKGFETIEGSEDDLQAALATVPVAISLDVTEQLQFYVSGIFSDPSCSENQLNHNALAVGYGADNGNDLWIVKNSWGSSWGENGYFRIARNQNNMCGVASNAIYPTV